MPTRSATWSGLYLDPPRNALVFAVDEKNQMQAIDRTAPILPVMPTTPAGMTHDYVRHGTASLFAALDLFIGGSVIAQHYRRHHHQEFLRFLKPIDAAVPKDPGHWCWTTTPPTRPSRSKSG